MQQTIGGETTTNLSALALFRNCCTGPADPSMLIWGAPAPTVQPIQSGQAKCKCRKRAHRSAHCHLQAVIIGISNTRIIRLP
jgi:hypothetical protein